MHSSTPPPQNDLSSGAIDALLKGLSAADAAAAQAEIDRLIQSAVSDAEVRHEREALAAQEAHQREALAIKEVHQREALALQEAFQSEALAAQEAYQREILAKQEAHQLEALAAEAAHQKEMREAHAAYQEHIQSIYEQIRLSRQRLFGRSSEAHPGQLSLQFDEVEQTAEGSTDEHDQALMSAVDAQAPEGTQKAGRSAPRARGKRSPIPPHITRVEIVIDVPESQRVCPCCGKTMVAIGEDISEQLTIIPMKIQALQYHRKRYGCPTREHAPVIADRPPQVLPKTNASNDLLAMLITAKYVDGRVLRTIKQKDLRGRCFIKDEGRPLEVGFQEQASNHHKLRNLRVSVVSVDGKGGYVFRQVRVMETSASELLMTCRNVLGDVKTGRDPLSRDKDEGYLITAHLASGMKAA